MKKTIFNNLFSEVSVFFLICSFTLTLIVWIIQAVNFIDIVSEDGHSFFIYINYTLLVFPKIFGQVLPIIFFAFYPQALINSIEVSVANIIDMNDLYKINKLALGD